MKLFVALAFLLLSAAAARGEDFACRPKPDAPRPHLYPAPAYPSIPMGAHVSGTVDLCVEVLPTGHVGRIKIVSGPAALHQTSIDAVRLWEWEPLTINGKPVAFNTGVAINFVAPKD